MTPHMGDRTRKVNETDRWRGISAAVAIDEVAK
jgi:hypothetical protein